MAELKLWGSGYRTNKVKLVAAFAGVNVEQQLTFTHGTTNKTPQFLAMNDLGKVLKLSNVCACIHVVAAVWYFRKIRSQA
jgi:Glutathione S-transferase, N-terminal domain